MRQVPIYTSVQAGISFVSSESMDAFLLGNRHIRRDGRVIAQPNVDKTSSLETRVHFGDFASKMGNMMAPRLLNRCVKQQSRKEGQRVLHRKHAYH